MKTRFFLIGLICCMSLSSCEYLDFGQDQQSNRPPYIPYSGTVNTTLGSSILISTTWVIYKYRLETDLNYQYISDTIRFVGRYQYYYGSTNQLDNYSLVGYDNYYSLSLDHTRFGSQITCSNISKYSLENGDIQQAKFKDNTIGYEGEYYYLFVRRL